MTLESKINLQQARLTSISTSFDFFKHKDVTAITKNQIKTRLEVLEATWSKFANDHERILEAKSEVLQTVPYVLEDHFGKAQEAYMDNKSKMLDLLDSVCSARHADAAVATSVQSHARPLLPKIALPSFSGDYQSWKPFSDLFTSLVTSNHELTDVAKLHYLKNSLVGEAAQLVSNFQVTGDNFAPAWNKLVSKYENKRVLINKHLDDMFSIKPLKQKSATGLNHLISTVNECLGALSALGSPTNHWDHIIVHLVIHRLDQETHEAWEIEQGCSTEPSTLAALQTFIEGRVRALESVESREVSESPGIKEVSSRSQPGNQSKPKPKATFVPDTPVKHKNLCQCCKKDHYLSFCKEYTGMPPIQRKEFLISKKLCFNCLGSHPLKDCRSKKTCLKCHNRHHTSIHDVNSFSNVSNLCTPSQSLTCNSSNEGVSSSSTTKVSSNHSHPIIGNTRQVVLLATAQVKVIGPGGNSIVARALIDQGSEISFISERLVQTLNIKRTSSSVSLVGIGGNQTSTTRGVVSINLGCTFNKEINCHLVAHILPKLTSNLPSMEPTQSDWTHLKGLKLADPTFMTPGPIDLVLGADIYGEIILPELIKGPSLTPIAQSTIFGWILSGPTGVISSSPSFVVHHCTQDDNINDLIQSFWEQEEIPKSQASGMSPDNEACEDHFKSTHTRTENGRYVVKLPLKEQTENLGDSHSSALKMLNSQMRKFNTNPVYYKLYSDFLTEYEYLNHMSKVEKDSRDTSPTFYLPHHGVLRETSSTTKLRVVFNGSKRSSSGKSLNDILHTGRKLQTNISDVLIWFRHFKYVFSTDIEKMYRQIMVHPDDQDLQRILWYDSNNQICIYRLHTVTYGLSCAPFLALRTMEQLVLDHGEQFPLGASTLAKGRYVDDIFGGADTVEECQEVVKQVDQLCMAGCFPLQKWISNNLSTLASIPQERYVKEASINIGESVSIRTLGLIWKPVGDEFKFQIEISPILDVTKRNVMSQIAKLFDPLGFIAPVIVQAKIFLQQLWLIKLSWDELLPPRLISQWKTYESQLQDLPDLRIPRFLGLTKSSSCHIEFHGFSDASQSAMSAVIYLKVQTDSGISLALVCSKTKVAPLKKMSIPRLELTAALMLVRLAHYVRGVLDRSSTPLWLWTDSRVALTWIQNLPSKWKDFVCNRVGIIQETEPLAQWRFVPGKDNPADCASRGISVKSLKTHRLWWSGPSWLAEDSSKWPTNSYELAKEAVSELRTQKTTHLIQPKTEPELLQKFSNLNKLLRVTSWCKRFINRSRKVDCVEKSSFLTPIELHESLLLWTSIVQQESFAEDLKLLKSNRPVNNSSKLRNFNPFLDKNNLLRVGGRLDQSSLDYDVKHPLLLPKDSSLSKLIINDAHLRTLHSGTTNTLAKVRQQFWILGGRPIVKKELLRCVTCARYRAERAQQLMGQLPPTRVTPSRPFTHSGVDYAGPFTIKTWRGRSAKSSKGYIVIFICSATSAIHLELVTDYSSEAFIAAYKRFSARRGLCSTLTSDCGTTFIGADAELKRLFTASTSESNKLRDLLAKDGTVWKFNPPSAPHFGGHWEAGVKSVKYHLKRIVGTSLLTYEEFTTVLAQIEGVLNSRPLCKLTDDPDDLSVLTPAHFLTGQSLTSVPVPDLLDVSVNRLSRWQLMQQMFQSFWRKWSREYLQHLQCIYKWRFPSQSIQVGSIVLIINEQYPPSKWPLAKVIETHPGKDNLVRVVTLRTSTGKLTRPITKLCPLPV